MSTATSALDVCRLALDLLDQDAEEVTSIDTPETENEKICARWYDVTRRAMLREGVWNFAIKRAVLTKSNTPSFGYADAYNLPNDFLRYLTTGADEQQPEVDYEIENGQILIDNNAGNLNLRYIFDQTDVTKFDSSFVEAFSIRLARNMAKKITGKDSSAKSMIEIWKDLVGTAYSVDGQERPPRKVDRSRWRAARKSRSKAVAPPYYDTT